MSKGLFITLEGGEGSGKSTQIKALAQRLRDEGYEVVTTREPGGTPEAEKIRELLVKRDGGNWTPEAEVLLLFAARQMHVENLIRPALAMGKIVISDRFTDSTRAYQSYGHGAATEIVEEINKLALDGFAPDLTFILDVPVETGLARAGKRLQRDKSGEDRFENLDVSFHERLRQGYLDIARKEPKRCVVIDATQPVEKITAALVEKTLARLRG
jgi:dTMP kinase